VDVGGCLFMSVDELLPSVSCLRCHTSLFGRNPSLWRYNARASLTLMEKASMLLSHSEEVAAPTDEVRFQDAGGVHRTSPAMAGSE
jgi:hypothetical protein